MPFCFRLKCLDLKADPDRTAEGVVIEASSSIAVVVRLPPVLIQKGTLHPGDILVAGSEWGRVRALVNDRGEHVKEAGPAMPVEILGLQGTPQAGDCFAVVATKPRPVKSRNIVSVWRATRPLHANPVRAVRWSR